MKTMVYDNKHFWIWPNNRAIRHHKSFGRVEILTWEDGGEVQFKSRTTLPALYKSIKSELERVGLA